MSPKIANVVRQMSVWTPAERLVVAGRILREGHPELALAIAEQVVLELQTKAVMAGVGELTGAAS
jgi:hypothetical protein